MSADLPTRIVNVRQYKTRKTNLGTYDVELESKEASALVRNTFGRYWKKAQPGVAKPALPQLLSNISITISHTFATRIRVRILKQMAKLHQAANPDLSVFVTNYLPRPSLKVRASSGKIDTYFYVEAIKRFGHHLKSDFLIEEAKYAKGHISLDALLPHFLVLSPDLIAPPNPLTPAPTAPTRSTRQGKPGTARKAPKRGSDDSVTPRGKKGVKSAKKPKGPAKGRAGQPSQGTSSTLATSNQFSALASPGATESDVDGSINNSVMDVSQMDE